MVGFEDQTESLVNRLTDRKNSQRDVVSIIGMGGLGKTTLANKIFTLVKDRFDCYAWVHVSQAYQKRRLFLDMLKCFGSNFSDEIYSNKSDEDLVVEIRDYLRGKRYFVVMDDVWETQVWDEVKAALPDDENGSRILITGRHKDIASHASSSGSHLLICYHFLMKMRVCNFCQKKWHLSEPNLISLPILKILGSKLLKDVKDCRFLLLN